MLSHLRGMCFSWALKLNGIWVSRVSAPICRQSSLAPLTCRFYTNRPVTATRLPVLRLTTSILSGRLGLHTSSQHLKRRKDPDEVDYSALLGSYAQELKKAPKSTMSLSLVGLIPLVAVPVTMSITKCYHPELAFLQLAGANCVLCFFGGIRWGFAAPESSPAKLGFVLGAMLPYIAWMSLILWENIGVSALMLIGGLITLMFGGVGMLPPYPFWLTFLKTVFSIVAFCSIIATLWMSSFYPEKPLKKVT
ncbi:transmembrane protein 69 [Mixophyes fleayi]|uniref:transmembrane protein 69 n=1 Tax=Mixophyes fleayi TaxID=3061075 RepID=UPI003F4E1197